MQMANRHMKRCSMLLVVREMQIKATMRYHFLTKRMAIIKESESNVLVKMWRKRNPVPCLRKHTTVQLLW